MDFLSDLSSEIGRDFDKSSAVSSSPFVVELYRPSMLKSGLLLKINVDALLNKRGFTRKDLAQYCHHTESWISKIYDRNKQRTFPTKYLDRVADFFGMAAYELLIPGVSELTERRSGKDRRGRKERRTHYPPALAEAAQELEIVHPKGRPLSEDEKRLLKAFRRSQANVQDLVMLAAGAPKQDTGLPRRRTRRKLVLEKQAGSARVKPGAPVAKEIPGSHSSGKSRAEDAASEVHPDRPSNARGSAPPDRGAESGLRARGRRGRKGGVE